MVLPVRVFTKICMVSFLYVFWLFYCVAKVGLGRVTTRRVATTKCFLPHKKKKRGTNVVARTNKTPHSRGTQPNKQLAVNTRTRFLQPGLCELTESMLRVMAVLVVAGPWCTPHASPALLLNHSLPIIPEGRLKIVAFLQIINTNFCYDTDTFTSATACLGTRHLHTRSSLFFCTLIPWMQMKCLR